MKKRKTKCPSERITRRDFLKSSALLGAGFMVGGDPVAHEFENFGHRRFDWKPRIVRVHNPNATYWDYETEFYFDFINQDVVNEMVREGIFTLTRGAPGQIIQNYVPGDKWSIKINCNNYADDSNDIDATAPVINAVLSLLIDFYGVPPSDIYVYDCSRPIPAFRIRDRIPYPVNYVESGDPLTEADPSSPIQFRYISEQYMPLVLSQHQHLINIPLFKDHFRVLATLAFKNHLGTTRPGPSYLHSNINYNLSDLNANSHIRDKTRLIISDALFGVWDGGPYGPPMQWETFPDGPTPNSIFLGFDPVAHESVMLDYLIAEQEFHGIPLLSHDYLHDAMEYHELGVHEHRDEMGEYHEIDYEEVRQRR